MTDATWTKLPPLDGRANPCLCCPPIPARLPLDAVIAVGFGDAHASKDGEEVYREPSPYFNREQCETCAGTGRIGGPPARDPSSGSLLAGWDALPKCEQCDGRGEIKRDPSIPEPEYWDVAEVEKLAAADPDHDWQIVLFGPLHGEVYQRHGDGEWNLVEKNEGFA